MNAIAEFLERIFSDDGITLAALAFFILVWIIYRIGGYHIDLIYKKFISFISSNLKIISRDQKLIRASEIIIEQHQIIENLKISFAKSRSLLDIYQGKYIKTEIENSKLRKEIKELRKKKIGK